MTREDGREKPPCQCQEVTKQTPWWNWWNWWNWVCLRLARSSPSAPFAGTMSTEWVSSEMSMMLLQGFEEKLGVSARRPGRVLRSHHGAEQRSRAGGSGDSYLLALGGADASAALQSSPKSPAALRACDDNERAAAVTPFGELRSAP